MGVLLQGKSIFKNTDAVMRCWMNHADFPPLTVVLRGLVLERVQRAHPAWFKKPWPVHLTIQTQTCALLFAARTLFVAIGQCRRLRGD